MGNTNTHSTQLHHHQPQTQQQQEKSVNQPQIEQIESSNSEITCEICIEPTTKPFNNSNKCTHPFCTDCVTKYIHTNLTDNNNGRITCPAIDCHQTLDPLDFSPIVSPSLFLRWCDVLCEELILGVESCYCPYRSCGVLIVNECGGNLKKVGCPKCKRMFCFKCKGVWHAGFGCEESGVLRDPDEVAFGRLAEVCEWQRCPKCRHFVEHVEGCKIVKCRCSISFCYRCGKQVHSHYCPCTPGSRCCGRCMMICFFLVIFTIVFFFLTLVAGAIFNKETTHGT